MNARTRVTLFGVLLAVGILAIVAAVAWAILFPEEAPAVLPITVGLLAIVLVGEIALLVFGRSKRFDEEGEWRDWEEQTTAAARELILRCTTCGNTFTVQDTGERPLRHACPHCGRVGILKDPAPASPSEPPAPPE